MESLTYPTINIIISGATLIVLGVMYFRKPQVKMDKELSIIDQKLNDHKDKFDIKFDSLKECVGDLRRNDIHSIEVRQDQMSKILVEHTKALVELKTIIDERIPKEK